MFLGADGCKVGWAVATIVPSGEFTGIAVVNNFASVIALAERMQAVSIHVDIPIGLSETENGRAPDRAAKRFLGVRSSTVFPVPIRAAVYAEDYASACARNEAITGKRISKQTWNICDKIKQVDRALPGAVPVIETHPEVLFAVLNGGQPLLSRKKDSTGRGDRLALLRKYIARVDETFLLASKTIPRGQASLDDLIDAMVCAASSYLSQRFGAVSLPSIPPLDQRGLPMQIVYPRLFV